MRITGGSRRDTNDNSPAEDLFVRRFEARHAHVAAIGELVAEAIVGGVKLLRAAAARVRAWHAAQVHRHELGALSDRELSDIGISRGDIVGIVAGTFDRDTRRGAAPALRKPELMKPRAANDGGRPKPGLRHGGSP
jgi:uncharacterized protein YjiS (DUF1127 family)